MNTKVGVLGAGRMGSAVARTLIDAGHAVAVWNRTPGRAAAIAGANVAPSAGAVVRDADVVLAILSDYAVTDAVLRAPEAGDALRGKVLVQFASGSPDLARETAAWAAGQGVRYLDGAIMATPNFIGRPEAALLYSGGRDVFEAAEAVLRILGGGTTFVGEDAGLASALDTALLTQMWGALAGALQAVAVTDAESVPFDGFLAQFAAFKPVVDGAVADLLERARDGRLSADAETLASIATHHGAFVHLVEIARARRLDMGLPQALDGLFRRALADGRGGDDFAALLRFVRAPEAAHA